MISRTVEITNKIGFHARPASLLIEGAKKYDCSITISVGDKSTDLKSIVSLLKLGVRMGDMITISAQGEGEEQALAELVGLVESKFGEE